MSYVRLTKLAAAPGGLPPETMDERVCGGHTTPGKSIPIGYTVEGYASDPIEPGSCVCMYRRKRNGVVVDGLFQTSCVKHLTDEGFVTENSVYRVDELPDPQDQP